MINVGICTGYWSTNIGNSFFQKGAEYLLQKVFPEMNIFPIGDEAGYINPKNGNPIHSYNPVLDSKVDYLVILGPFVRPEFFKVSSPTIEYLAKKGTKIIALGVGMMDYSPATIRSVSEFFSKYPPVLFSTRDTETYNAFKPYISNIYNGIDLGFFVSDIWKDSPKFIGKRYVTLNFDQIPEPIFDELLTVSSENSIIIGEKSYELKFNSFRKKFCEKGFLFQLADQLLLPQAKTTHLKDYRIIRTEHRYNPVLLSKIYKSPNTYSGDVPYSYLQIYKNTEITFSNRVHACVATLAFGNKAMLFTKSPRAFLLDRVKAFDIKNKPVSVNMDYLESEKENLLQYLQNNFK